MKGKVDWHYKVDVSPMNEVTATFRYSGYQVAYILYGKYMSLVLIKTGRINYTQKNRRRR